MKITIKPKDSGKKNYVDGFRCPGARALRRKGIFALVGPDYYFGLFLFLIPVWGKISTAANDRLYHAANHKINNIEIIEIGLYK